MLTVSKTFYLRLGILVSKKVTHAVKNMKQNHKQKLLYP